MAAGNARPRLPQAALALSCVQGRQHCRELFPGLRGPCCAWRKRSGSNSQGSEGRAFWTTPLGPCTVCRALPAPSVARPCGMWAQTPSKSRAGSNDVAERTALPTTASCSARAGHSWQRQRRLWRSGRDAGWQRQQGCFETRWVGRRCRTDGIADHCILLCAGRATVGKGSEALEERGRCRL